MFESKFSLHESACILGSVCSVRLCPPWLDPRILGTTETKDSVLTIADVQNQREISESVKFIHCQAGWGSFRLAFKGNSYIFYMLFLM